MRIKHTVLALALAAAFGAASAAEPAKDSKDSKDSSAAAKAANAELERARAEFKDAEARMRESARRLAELSAKAGGEDGRHAYAYRYFNEPKRAMIGIVLGDDVQGAYIAGVTPGAPAARAGVKSGDKLVAVNGKPVPAGAQGEGKVGRAARGDDATQVARGMIGELEAGQHVKLTVERQGKRMDFDLAAEQREARELPMWVGEFEPGDFDVHVDVDPVQIERDVRVIVDKTDAAAKAGAMAGARLGSMKHLEHMSDGMHELLYLSDGNFSNLRMGSLNPDLGRYFGADSGVLVLENKGQRIPELKAGDVITTVAGKRVNTPSEVMRELRSGTPGASVNVEILRDKKRQIVALDVPEHGPMLLPMPPEPPEPPTPPAAPAAPTPPAPPTPPPTPKAAPPLPPAPPSPPEPPPPPRETVAFDAQVI